MNLFPSMSDLSGSISLSLHEKTDGIAVAIVFLS